MSSIALLRSDVYYQTWRSGCQVMLGAGINRNYRNKKIKKKKANKTWLTIRLFSRLKGGRWRYRVWCAPVGERRELGEVEEWRRTRVGTREDGMEVGHTPRAAPRPAVAPSRHHSEVGHWTHRTWVPTMQQKQWIFASSGPCEDIISQFRKKNNITRKTVYLKVKVNVNRCFLYFSNVKFSYLIGNNNNRGHLWLWYLGTSENRIRYWYWIVIFYRIFTKG